jgi:predicted TIM-barrel fold metal-dependent hydrolase
LAELKYGFISADDHVQETPDLWTSRVSRAKWGEKVPHIERLPDGDCWVVCGRRVGFPAPPLLRGDGRVEQATRWDEIPSAAYDPSERLKALDADGVDYSVLYPSVAGLAGEGFGWLDDPELELACVQAYNDWLIEEWLATSSRFVPQCIVPLFPVSRTVEEIERAVRKGHRGVIYPASPMELRRVPHINDPDYDPLWAVCQDLNVPICFHAGASRRIQLDPGEGFSPPRAAAFRHIVRSVSSVAVVANFLFSRVLERYPKLRVVFAESSLGWGAYELEYADYQSEADGLRSEGYALRPSELFQRQCYFTCWQDRTSLRVRRHVGISNILWSAHVPLSWPRVGTERPLAAAFDGMEATEREAILWRNAAALYSL